MKMPAAGAPGRPPPDDADKRFHATESIDNENSRLAARKRLEALEAIKRNQSSGREQSNGQEAGKNTDPQKPGSEKQDSKDPEK